MTAFESNDSPPAPVEPVIANCRPTTGSEAATGPAADLFPVLFEDAELLVLNKPAGLVCHPTKGDATSSLIGRVRLYLGATAMPHLVNRLDRETSGVTLVAKNREVAGELGKIFEQRAVLKEYLAIVHGHLPDDRGVIDAPLGRDESSAVAIKDRVRADGAPAQTVYRVLRRFHRGGQPFTLLQLWPRTGRKHQLRIHLAHLGHPLVGDKLYGGDETLYLAFVRSALDEAGRRRLLLPHQALHAAALRFLWRERVFHFRAPPERWFIEFLRTGD